MQSPQPPLMWRCDLTRYQPQGFPGEASQLLLLASADFNQTVPELSTRGPSVRIQKSPLEEKEVDFFFGNLSPMYSYNK